MAPATRCDPATGRPWIESRTIVRRSNGSPPLTCKPNPLDSPTYTVAVRTLCAFAAKSGDLDLRFTPSPSAQEGVAGHRTVAASRSPAYRSEVSLDGRYRHLRVRGRADGYDAASRTVEEVKTFRGALDRMPGNHRQLHWAQAKVYAWLLCQRDALADITVSLVYFDVGRQREEPALSVRCDALQLRAFFEALCERFVAWADQEIAHRRHRDDALTSLCFPYASFRRGQRELAEAVFKATRRGRCLMAQAPTGIGKTVATLFPALKACPVEAIDKLFFLTAKGTGRRLALDALASLRAGVRQPLRVIELTAREKACEHPDRACHGESCPLARGFYDRLPAARAAAVVAAVDTGALDRDAMRRVGLAHDVCPYYLAQDLIAWSDVVVGDYNHYFDGGAVLAAAAESDGWRVAVLVDEAHNLVERARAMYSASLASSDLEAVRVTAPASLRKPLDRLQRAWNRFTATQGFAYVVHDACPRPLESAIREAVVAMHEVVFESDAETDGLLQRFAFDAMRFARLLDSFGAHSLFDSSIAAATGRKRSGVSTLCVRNVVPAPFIGPRIEQAHATTLFSATLTPDVFYRDLLGLPDDVLSVDVDTPFRPEQLSVDVVRRISTRYRHRGTSLAPIARVIAERYAARAGNYLAFFSSFDYLQQVADVLERHHPQVPAWRQDRRMSDGERSDFLDRFVVDGRGVGFAVLGGAFAEGIDLVGTRLIGAFIATLGLPQVNPVNEEMRRRMETIFGAGYDYTYLYPGIRKVTQAAGRVIRTLSDTGSVVLIDDRFGRDDVTALLPRWWRIDGVSRASGHAR